jgi:HlyD family secretion protein
MQSEAVHAPLVIDPRLTLGATRRRRLLVSGLLLFGLVAGAVLFFRSRPEPPRYRTAPVERRTITREVELAGHLAPLRRVEVPAPIAAQLVEVTAVVGQKVRAGDTLARLDERALVIAARGATAGVAAASSRAAEASAVLRTARERRERVERLRARDLASESELAAATATETEARAALATARAEEARAAETLRGARLTESSSILRSPIDGVVLQAPESTGAGVDPSAGPLFVVGSDLATLRIHAEVSESDVGELRVDQKASFSVPAHPNRSFEAKVERIGLDARRSAVSVYYAVELRAADPAGLLRPGMTTTVRVAVAVQENALAVRDAALRYRPDGAEPAAARSRVFRLDGTRLSEVRVKAGLSDGAFTAVTPDPPGTLGPGAELAIGVLSGAAENDSGPGIRLGNR